ncbi:hypothetical protein ACQPWY_29915 [Pseudonocardia xinjiangensis]|uniref:hypothetical protein n=1 Tax=Pseudonocardia xinjiangensis TaxID=75289 RepID=UPI003D8D3B45
MEHLIELANATKRFPNGKGGIHTAIRDVTLTVEPGQFVAVVGPASSMYMDCSYVDAHPGTVQKLANAFVKTLGYINSHSGAEIAAQMPADYAAGSGGVPSYAAAIDASKGMFNSTGVMDAEGAKNVLQVLSQFNPNVKGKADSVDLTKTYTTDFTTKVARS